MLDYFKKLFTASAKTFDGSDTRPGSVPDTVSGSVSVSGSVHNDYEPLHLAALSGQNEIVIELLKKGEKVNMKDQFGYTALHFATMNGHDKVVKTLLESGANVDERRVHSNKNAVRFAVSAESLSTLTLLLQYGADPDAVMERPNQKKLTASEAAASNIDPHEEIQIEIIKELNNWGGTIDSDFINELTCAPETKKFLQNLNTDESIKKRDEKLLDEITKSILEGVDDGKIPCTEFVSKIKLRAIKSIKLDESADHSKIKPIYRKLIEINDIGVKANDTENSDKMIKAILQYPKDFEKLVETVSKLKITSKAINQDSTTATQDLKSNPGILKIFSKDDLRNKILEESLSSNFKKTLGASVLNLIDYLFSNPTASIKGANSTRMSSQENSRG